MRMCITENEDFTFRGSSPVRNITFAVLIPSPAMNESSLSNLLGSHEGPVCRQLLVTLAENVIIHHLRR